MSANLKISFSGNIASHKSWLEFLTGDEFMPKVKSHFETSRNLGKTSDLAKLIVQSEIYDTYDPVYYVRTDSLLNSMKSSGVDSEFPGMLVYSDVDKAPSVAGKNPGEFSYAVFFEDERFKSFIKQTGKPVRPFVSQLTKSLQVHQETMASNAIRIAIKSRMPRSKG